MDDQQHRTAEFHRLHSTGCFVMPNPWDAGSARALQQLGFPALATTSSAFAWTQGRADTEVALERVLEHLRAMTAAVTVPVNADFEGGYAVEPADVATNVGRAVGTGISGLSIEDASGDGSAPLLDLDLAVERVAAARRAIDESGTRVLLTGRSEGFICGRPDLEETVRRLSAYAGAGADCLYAPGVRDSRQVAAIVSAVSPRPVNLLVNGPFMTVAEAADLGVRRISVGGTLARTAWRGFLDAAREIADAGTFAGFASLPDVDGLFRDRREP